MSRHCNFCYTPGTSSEIIDSSVKDLEGIAKRRPNLEERYFSGVLVFYNHLHLVQGAYCDSDIQKSLKFALLCVYEQESRANGVVAGVLAEAGLFKLVTDLKSKGIDVDWSQLWAEINREQKRPATLSQ